MKKVSIFGIGRVGLPLALAYAEAGCGVWAVDIDEKKLEQLRNGTMPFMDEGADELLAKHKSRIQFTTDAQKAVQESDAVILTLGTPLDSHWSADFSQINSVMENILPYIKESQVIVLRSTVTPGTTEYLKSILEDKGFSVGKNLYLVYIPERIAQGKSIEEIRHVPQIIGGDEESRKKAAEIVKLVTNKVLFTDTRSAELVKIFCNMYRYVNFAIANEFARIAEDQGCNIYEIIDLANEDYLRGGLKKPGLTAGPCLYKDGFFVSQKDPHVGLIQLSWKVNETFPDYIVDRIKKTMPSIKGKKVALLGLAFKANHDDDRNSLAHRLKKLLRWEQANLHIHDPYLAAGDINDILSKAEIVVIATNHSEYSKLSLEELKQRVKPGCVIADPWNCTDAAKEKGLVFRV